MKTTKALTTRIAILAVALSGTTIVAGMAVGVGLASSANATIAIIGSRGDHDLYNYRDELRYTGLYHEDATNAESLESRVCGRRAMSYTEEQLVRGLEGPDPLYTSEQAVMIVEGAEYHFCPTYEDDGSVGRGYTGPPETM
ncbi:MAG TPA: DUF732 domain-containing protein [Mycobacterium sp.]